MDFEKKLELAKLALHWTTRFGSSAIVSSIVYTHVQPETVVEKIKIGVGCVMISGVVSEHAANHADEVFDTVHNFVEEALEKRRQHQAKMQNS